MPRVVMAGQGQDPKQLEEIASRSHELALDAMVQVSGQQVAMAKLMGRIEDELKTVSPQLGAVCLAMVFARWCRLQVRRNSQHPDVVKLALLNMPQALLAECHEFLENREGPIMGPPKDKH